MLHHRQIQQNTRCLLLRFSFNSCPQQLSLVVFMLHCGNAYLCRNYFLFLLGQMLLEKYKLNRYRSCERKVINIQFRICRESTRKDLNTLYKNNHASQSKNKNIFNLHRYYFFIWLIKVLMSKHYAPNRSLTQFESRQVRPLPCLKIP